jgi:hypothetical protein
MMCLLFCYYIYIYTDILQDELALAYYEQNRRRHVQRRRERRYWVRPWLIRRPDLGKYENLMRELQAEDMGHSTVIVHFLVIPGINFQTYNFWANMFFFKA